MVKFGKWINNFYWWDFPEFVAWENERRKVNIRIFEIQNMRDKPI